MSALRPCLLLTVMPLHDAVGDHWCCEMSSNYAIMVTFSTVVVSWL